VHRVGYTHHFAGWSLLATSTVCSSCTTEAGLQSAAQSWFNTWLNGTPPGYAGIVGVPQTATSGCGDSTGATVLIVISAGNKMSASNAPISLPGTALTAAGLTVTLPNGQSFVVIPTTNSTPGGTVEVGPVGPTMDPSNGGAEPKISCGEQSSCSGN
jgi:hypothetical protein